MKKIIGLILIISMTVLTGCVIEIYSSKGFNVGSRGFNVEVKPGVSVKTGELNTFVEEINLGNQKSLDVQIRTNAAKVEIKKDEEKLFRGKVESNIVGFQPLFNLSGSRLSIRDDYNYSGLRGNIINDWNLSLTNQIPLDIEINSNASRNIFDFTGMKIEGVSLNLNAANTEIKFNEKNDLSIKRFKIDTNAGNTDIYNFGNSRVEELSIKSNAAKVDIDFGNSVYNDTEINIDANAAKVILDIPENVGVRVRKRGNLSSIEISRGRFNRISDDEYESENYNSAEFKVTIDLRGTASSVTVK